MISKLTCQLIIGLLPLLHMTLAGFHGDVCSPSVHCNKTAGLICSNGRCACSNGPLTDKYSYDLVWDATTVQCVGQHGSACIGTRRTPIPEGMKPVHCADAFTCIQINNMPLGLGSCQLVPKLQFNGATCDATNYCDSAKNLICTNGSCACATFRQNTSPEYELVWDEELTNCVAPVGKPCISTKESPVAAGHKSIDCVVEAVCVAQSGQTPGVGICEVEAETRGNSAAKLLHNQMVYLLIAISIMISSRYV